MCNWIKDPQGIIDYLRLVLQKKFFPGCLVISRMTFEFKYLGEFEFILKNNLGQESRDQERAFDGKKPK